MTDDSKICAKRVIYDTFCTKNMKLSKLKNSFLVLVILSFAEVSIVHKPAFIILKC